MLLKVFPGCYRVVPFISIHQCHQCPSTFISREGGDLDLEECYLGNLRLGRCPDEVQNGLGIFPLSLSKVSVSNSQSTPLALRAQLMSTIHVTMSCRKRECCNVPGPPYCVSSTGSQVARAFAGHPENHPVDNLHRYC